MIPAMTEGACVVCGSTREPAHSPVLWAELIDAWELTPREAASIDRREGQHCPDCEVRLRPASLAAAILREVGFDGTFEAWTASRPPLRLLEVNRVGQLTPWLERLPGHRLVEYPDVDMHELPDPDGSWDMVVHSETLEHVQDPVLALSECRRVLRPGGVLAFTVPVVPGRLSRRRDGLPRSYHGLESDPTYLVVTEYGADFWTQVLDAGFETLRIDGRMWPDAPAFVAC
jgi:SAM-dependent methyltransferase